MRRLFSVLQMSSFFINMHAQDYKSAVGIRISSVAPVQSQPITFRHFFSGQMALEGLLPFGDPIAIGILLQRFTPVGPASLNWFYAAGAYIGFSNAYRFGAQGILGLDYKISNLPINFSLDWKPEINMIRKFSFEPAAVALSARFILQ